MFRNLDKKIQTEFMRKIGNRRLGETSDLISTIDFIIENDYLSGGTIDLTGGLNVG